MFIWKKLKNNNFYIKIHFIILYLYSVNSINDGNVNFSIYKVKTLYFKTRYSFFKGKNGIQYSRLLFYCLLILFFLLFHIFSIYFLLFNDPPISYNPENYNLKYVCFSIKYILFNVQSY